MIRCAVAALGALVLGACATVRQDVQPRAQFMQQGWVAPDYRDVTFADRFPAVYVAPVETDLLKQQDWWQAQSVPVLLGQMSNDVEMIAGYMRGAILREIRDYPGNRMAIAQGPGKNTLIIEVALTELVPSKAFWNTAATTAGFVIPGAGLLSAAGRGSIAVEGRLRDGSTGRVIATFADRRSDLVAPINLRSYTWFAGADANINIWAKQGAKFLHAPPSELIKRTSEFTLSPW
jgi:hypothetical protein